MTPARVDCHSGETDHGIREEVLVFSKAVPGGDEPQCVITVATFC
jgi:hypothetical protein